MAKKAKTRKKGDEDEDLFDFVDEPFRSPKEQRGLKKNEWPEEVPILSADDVCYNFTRDNGSMDLLYWLDAVFGDTIKYSDAYHKPWQYAHNELEHVLAERTGRSKVDIWFFLENSYRDRFPPLKWIAGCWNETMRRLGYGVPKSDCRLNDDDGVRWGVKCVDSGKEVKPRQGPTGMRVETVARKQPVPRS